jgi:hypothetical protein
METGVMALSVTGMLSEVNGGRLTPFIIPMAKGRYGFALKRPHRNLDR